MNFLQGHTTALKKNKFYNNEQAEKTTGMKKSKF